MKAICIIENLKKGILLAEKIVGKNLTLPILSNILIEAERGGLRVSATNLEIGLITKIRAKVEKEGKIAIPGRIAGGILAQLEDGGKIELEEKNTILKIIYGKNNASIKGVDAKDFPIIPKPESKPLFEINALEFQKRVVNILASVASSDTRQELTGVFFEFKEDKLIMASTDSFRLSEASLKIPKEKSTDDYKKYLSKNNTAIIPSRTLAEVVRSISGEEENVQFYLAENQIFFGTANALFVSRLIDGKYPEYKQVVPKEFSLNVSVKKNEILKAAKLAGIFSDSKSREVRIGLEGEKNKMVIFAQSVESGEGLWSVSCQADNEKNLEVAFNNRFLLDCLNSLGTEDIAIGFNDAFGPVIFREIADGKPKNDYFHIIMPIRS